MLVPTSTLLAAAAVVRVPSAAPRLAGRAIRTSHSLRMVLVDAEMTQNAAQAMIDGAGPALEQAQKGAQAALEATGPALQGIGKGAAKVAPGAAQVAGGAIGGIFQVGTKLAPVVVEGTKAALPVVGAGLSAGSKLAGKALEDPDAALDTLQDAAASAVSDLPAQISSIDPEQVVSQASGFVQSPLGAAIVDAAPYALALLAVYWAATYVRDTLDRLAPLLVGVAVLGGAGYVALSLNVVSLPSVSPFGLALPALVLFVALSPAPQKGAPSAPSSEPVAPIEEADGGPA